MVNEPSVFKPLKFYCISIFLEVITQYGTHNIQLFTIIMLSFPVCNSEMVLAIADLHVVLGC